MDIDPPGFIRQLLRNYDTLYTAYRDVDFDFPALIYRLDDASRIEFKLILNTLNIHLAE